MTFRVTGEKTLTFIHIPRTGGTSIHGWFKVICKYAPNGYSIHKFSAPSHPGVNEIDSTGFTFCSVRNPWDRVVSLYSFLTKTVPEWTQHRPEQPWGFDITWTKDLSFTEFVERLPEWPNPLGKSYNFASPQVKWIGTGVDYIIRYENLEQDFKKIQEYIGFDMPLGHHNQSTHNNYTDYYNTHLQKLVSTYFAEDIDKFKYTYEN
jgi:hypothetical protein